MLAGIKCIRKEWSRAISACVALRFMAFKLSKWAGEVAPSKLFINVDKIALRYMEMGKKEQHAVFFAHECKSSRKNLPLEKIPLKSCQSAFAGMRN